MKKFLSLILAALLLLSCTALADNMAFDTRLESKYNKDGTTPAEKPSVNTQMWLQVGTTGFGDNSGVNGGQIDVTVPLVLIFQTSIDGGEASTAKKYGITNNSTADLVVTKMVAKTNTVGTSHMTMQEASANLARDQYKVTLVPDAVYGAKYSDEKTWDLYDTSGEKTYQETSVNGGVFELEAAKEETNGKFSEFTALNATMTTGALSFVTAHTDDNTLNTAKGLHLLTVTYTVAIDLSDAIGGNGTGTTGDGYTIPTADEHFKPAN